MFHSKFWPNKTGSFWQEKFWMKITGLGVQLPTAPSEKVESDEEHNHCLDAAY